MSYHQAIYPDFEGARDYALKRLEKELAPTLSYHSLWHTRDEVTIHVERIARQEGLIGEALMLVRTAAYFHDIGFVRQTANHESLSANIAAQVLPSFGYGVAHIQIICGIIMATRVPQRPENRLEEILADADLDVLGRADFRVRNHALRAELAAAGLSTTDRAWYSSQLHFLQSHRYFTAAQREARDAQKQLNMAWLADLVSQSQAVASTAANRIWVPATAQP